MECVHRPLALEVKTGLTPTSPRSQIAIRNAFQAVLVLCSNPDAKKRHTPTPHAAAFQPQQGKPFYTGAPLMPSLAVACNGWTPACSYSEWMYPSIREVVLTAARTLDIQMDTKDQVGWCLGRKPWREAATKPPALAIGHLLPPLDLEDSRIGLPIVIVGWMPIHV